MGEVVRLKEPKPLTRAAAASACPPPHREDEGKPQIENIGDGAGDNVGESEIERARRLPLSPARPRS